MDCGSCKKIKKINKNLHFGNAINDSAFSVYHATVRMVTLLSYRRVPSFLCSIQCAGAISGSALLLAITPAYARGTLGANELMNGTDIVQGVVVEFIMTTLLIFVICAATDERNKAKSIAPLAIGLTVTTAHLFGVSFQFSPAP